MRLFRRKDQEPPVPTEGWKERIKGVVQGTSFRFEPLAPKLDRLDTPVLLKELPAAPFPEQTLRSRLRRFLAGKRLDRHGPEQRLLWRFYDTVDHVLTLVSPEPYQAVKGLGLGLGGSQEAARPSPGITHPYQIKMACELLAELPEAFAAERRYLDELLVSILVAYRSEVSRRTIGSLSFFRESQEYLISGYRIEKSALSGTKDTARVAACQQIYDSYHHGINYYIYALLARESFDPRNNSFFMFCNALHFKARIEWNGNLLDRAVSRKLPSRNWVLYFALRDRTVLRQYQYDSAYARQFKDVLNSFPDDEPSGTGRKYKPAARSARYDREARMARMARPKADGVAEAKPHVLEPARKPV